MFPNASFGFDELDSFVHVANTCDVVLEGKIAVLVAQRKRLHYLVRFADAV